MDKTQILSFIKSHIESGQISESDVQGLLSTQSVNANTISQPQKVASKDRASKGIIYALYAIGGVIVLAGIIILIGQYWKDIGFFGRMAVTLGIGFVTYVIGLVMRGPQHRVLSQVMFTVSAALAPIGSVVFLDETKISFDSQTQCTVAGVLAIIYGVAYLISRRSVLVLFTTGFATWAYYALLAVVFKNNFYDLALLMKWAIILQGVSYICLGYAYISSNRAMEEGERQERKRVTALLYGLGSIAVLGGGIAIGGAFDLFYILFIFAAFYASVWLRSRMMLIAAAGFLIGHIIKLTSKYFVDSIGWPVALIGVGFLVIGIGYGTYYVNKKYLSSGVQG
jgi:uncharacterized membrane protein